MQRQHSQSKKRWIKKLVPWGCLALFGAVLLFLTHDIIITNYLAYRICKADPQPKTLVGETVEYPQSIYWEDNIYPGFDEKDRLLMIRNYLDGVHLKTMALNSSDGAIHVYSATEDDWRESSGIRKKTQKEWKDYFKTLDAEAGKIAARGKIYTRETMPPVNYKVMFNPVALTDFQRRYLWSDEVRIRNEKNNEIIAYNRRLMRRWYMILPDFVGYRYYSPKAMCGRNGLMYFDSIVLTQNSRKIVPAKHKDFLNQRLYFKEGR